MSSFINWLSLSINFMHKLTIFLNCLSLSIDFLCQSTLCINWLSFSNDFLCQSTFYIIWPNSFFAQPITTLKTFSLVCNSILFRFELSVGDVVKALQWKTETVLVEKSTKLNNLVSVSLQFDSCHNMRSYLSKLCSWTNYMYFCNYF